NRCDDVLRTLHVVVHACPYPDKEIVVVDNASSDRTVQRIHELFPDVIVIALKENTGTAGRNAFIRAARGRYLFCLDDDSLPGHAQHFTLITEWMERHPEVSLLSTRCLQPRTGVDETKDFALLGREWSGERVYEGHYAFECACCMRTDDIRAVGGYAAHDTWGAEGMELAMKLHMNGFRTVWHPGFTTLHFKQWKNRPAQSGSIGAVHHRIAFFASYLPWAVLLPLLAAYTLRRVIEAILHPSRLPGLARGYLRGIASIPASRHHRPKLTLRAALALGRWYIGVLRW
ncbi:MAG: glycosyltransferase family 2 protein, partial [Candidatus Kapaibacterium sp.]